MKSFMSIMAMAAIIGFTAPAWSTVAVAQVPPMPSPTDEKDKKPGSPRAADEKPGDKSKEERGRR
jgi:hypothetical protein